MLYYLTPMFLGFFISLNKVFNNTKTVLLEKMLIVFSLVIFCGGYMTGSDWVYYEPLYNEADISHLMDYEKEKGFYFLMVFFKFIGFTFYPFLILLKIIVFLLIIRFLKKYSENKFLLSFSIFLSTNALFIFVDNPLRYMIALGIITLAFDYFLKKKLLIFSILIFIASLFHVSSIIILIAYFTKFNRISTIKTVLIYVLILIVWTPNTIIYVIDNIFPSVTELIGWYYLQFLENQDVSYFSLGWFFNQVLFLLILFNKKKILNASVFGETFYNMCILYFFLSLTLGMLPTFFRVPIYLAVFVYIGLTIILSDLSKSFLLKTFVIFYFLAANIKNIDSTYSYIPYTNYFVYLFKEDLPFDVRANYNKNEYRKKTGKLPPEPFNPNEI